MTTSDPGPSEPWRGVRKLHHKAYEWGPVLAPRHQLRLANAALRNRLARRTYVRLSPAQLCATRSSDTVFVLGSGRSLLEITDEEWPRIEGCQTIAFGEFHRRARARVDYHMVNEVADPEAYGRSIASSPHYDNTIFVVQSGWIAHRGNEMIGRRLLPAGSRVFRYRRIARWRYAPPSASFSQGIVHGFNSSVDAVNLALLMGWSTIVLVGVDLFDRQYFYLEEGESTGGAEVAHQKFPGADHLLDFYGRWRPIVESRGGRLLVYRRSSLLSEALDTFSWGDA